MHCLFFLVRIRVLLSTGGMGRFFIRTVMPFLMWMLCLMTHSILVDILRLEI